MYQPNKKLGQNFLSDVPLVTRMVDALSLQQNDYVIEIGPGHGILTQELVNRIPNLNLHLQAVEIDPRFVDKLVSMYATEKNITIIEDDFLKWFEQYKSDIDYKILGSLPYYITSPILHVVVKAFRQPTACVFMVQKEVAEKVAAVAPDASYLSTFVQTFFDVTYLETVKRTMFDPVPEVDSAIIKLTKKSAIFEISAIMRYEGFLHKGFSHPRKMLNKAFTAEELEKAGIKPNLRAQNLTVADWVNFFKTIYA